VEERSETIQEAAKRLGITEEEAQEALESAESKTLSYFNYVEDMKREFRKMFDAEPTQLIGTPNMIQSLLIAKAIWDAEEFEREDDEDVHPTFCGLEIYVDHTIIDGEMYVL
jgi:DNA-directed RNA polymerase specialized sigma subunit